MGDLERSTRRSALSATAAVVAGSVAAVGLLGEALPAAENPAAVVADPFSAVKVTAVQSYPVGPKTLIRLDTSAGVSGWGEVSQLPPKVAVALIESIFDLLDGENPTRIEYLWQKLYRAHRDYRGGAFMVHTISGVDTALWDIAGKLAKTPVYRLMGGPTRERIRVYPTPKAFKTAAGGPFPFAATPREIAGLVERVADARKHVGPDGSVMFDAHCCLPPPALIQFAAAIEPYDVLWIEEPAVPGNIEVFKRLKQAIKIPIATGERDRGIWDVIPYLQNGCVDVLQPDCGHGGGPTQLRKVAALAEAYNTPIAPHSILTFLGQAASFHATAAVPNFLIHEYYPNDLQGVLHKTWETNKEGYVGLPQGPGLGVEVDEPKLKEVSANPANKFKWPGQKLRDGSIADY
jgi:galactonate dehydratase